MKKLFLLFGIITMLGYPKTSIVAEAEPSFSAKPKVAIIGAGLAGLTTAYYLKKKGYEADVFEARNRVA